MSNKKGCAEMRLLVLLGRSDTLMRRNEEKVIWSLLITVAGGGVVERGEVTGSPENGRMRETNREEAS